jgi:hypothetical protein
LYQLKEALAAARTPWSGAGWIVAAACLSALALVVMVAAGPNAFVYDERYYIVGAQLLAKGASFREFLLAPLSTPAGPLYPTLHYLLSPITQIQPWAIRWVNLALLGLAGAAISFCIGRQGYDHPAARAAMLLGVPMMWVCSGMALTEVPAFAAASLGCAALTVALTAPAGDKRRLWAGFLLAGLCLAIAVLGRQPYLPAVVGLVVIAVAIPRARFPALAAAALAIALPLPIFLLWGGIVPPQVAFVGGGLSPWHGVLGFAYLSIVILILAPRYYLTRWRWALGAGAVVGGGAALIGLLIGGLDVNVAAGVSRRLPNALATVFQFGIAAVLIGGAAALLVAMTFNMFERRQDHLFVLVTLITIGLTATAALVIHQFSSRYLMTAFPFILLAVQPYFTPSRWAAARLVLGSLIGFGSLFTYLHP